MGNLEEDITSLKAMVADICAAHDVSFIGFFQNQTRSFERVISEGFDQVTPNGSFELHSLNNISNNSDIQFLVSSLLNQSKVAATSSPKPTCGNLDTSVNLSNSYSLSSNSSSNLTMDEHYKKIIIDQNNKIDVKNYLYNCFEEFQQIPCKLLAKGWIKVIEPKKQSTYPYKNGNNSKPYWWPAGCVHREPDHLKKDERINLLINILRVFKQKEIELTYTASFIHGIGVKDSSLNSRDEVSERKLDLLKDMFRLVNSENDRNARPIKLIKPGKKYSSKFYKRNTNTKNSASTKVNASIANLLPPIQQIPQQEEHLLKFSDLLATPPSTKLKSDSKTKEDLSFQTGEQVKHYNDLMTYITSKEGEDKNYHMHTANCSILSSPFVSSNHPPSKYSYALRTPPQKRINRLLGVKHKDYDIDPNFYQGPSPSLNLTANAFSSNRNKSLTPIHNSLIPHQVSPPPTGVFKTSKSSPLGTLNFSKLNTLNANLNKAIFSKHKTTIKTFSLSSSKSSIKSSSNAYQQKVDEDTDYEDN